jgi:hypothetical protein
MLLYYKHYVVYNILKQTTNILPHDVPMIFPWKLPIFSMKKKNNHTSLEKSGGSPGTPQLRQVIELL